MPTCLFPRRADKQMKTWRSKVNRLIVCMDANNHIYKGAIGTALTDNNGLAMKEVVLNATGKALGATYFRESTPIDGIWATRDIGIANACVMPAGYGVGDHRLFVVDLITSTLTGNNSPKTKIQRPAALGDSTPNYQE